MDTKHTDTPVFPTKNTTTNTSLQPQESADYLLQESSSYLLQESNERLILEPAFSVAWSYQTKH